MPLLLNGNVYTGAGAAVVGATVELLARNTLTPVLATYTGGTTAAGLWNFSYTVGADRRTDVRITNGTSITFLKYDDQIQVSSVETAALRVINPAFSFIYDIVPAAITADRTLNLPLITATDTIAVLGLAQTYTAQQIISVSNAAALSVGPNGDTNPVFRVVTNTASAATGLAVTGAAAGSRVAVAALSSGANEGLDIDAKGSGTIRLGNTSTGNIVLGRAVNVQGVWVADATWTLPALTLGGTVTLNGQTLSGASTFSGATTFSAVGTALTVNNALQVGTIELGAAADTTLSRVSAGLIAVEGVTVVDVSTAQTLTNKTLSAPVFSGAYSFGGTPTFGATMAGASTFSGAITLSAATGNTLIVDTSTLVVDATNNRVGIGTTAPEFDFEVSTNSQTVGGLTAYGGGNSAALVLRHAGGTAASPSATTSAQYLGTISYRGRGATAFSGGRVILYGIPTENWTDTAQGTAWYVQTTITGGTTTATRLYIDGTGSTILGGSAIGAGTFYYTYGAGVQLGQPTGGDKGAGTMNAVAVYDDNVLLTDWIFEEYYGASVRSGMPKRNGARLWSFHDTETFVRANHALPWMPSWEAFEKERSLGRMVTRLWEGQEHQQLYLFEQDARINALEQELAGLKHR